MSDRLFNHLLNIKLLCNAINILTQQDEDIVWTLWQHKEYSRNDYTCSNTVTIRPNGLRNTVLWKLDQIDDRYKKYRVPSHNNPHYTYEFDQENLKAYGGDSDDRYIQLVLGRHGAAAYQVIPRESIQLETYPFLNIRYSSVHKLKGAKYQDIIQTPKLPDCVSMIMAIDLGFVDPTLIQILGKDRKGVWRTFIRYRLTRIDFNEQEKIIDYLASHYNLQKIVLDSGTGG